jgi:hypothetical protein
MNTFRYAGAAIIASGAAVSYENSYHIVGIVLGLMTIVFALDGVGRFIKKTE